MFTKMSHKYMYIDNSSLDNTKSIEKCYTVIEKFFWYQQSKGSHTIIVLLSVCLSISLFFCHSFAGATCIP